MSGSVNWTNRQVAQRGGMSSPTNKYGARRKELDGIVFASTREALRYQQLKIEEKVGAIHNLTLQPRFVLQPAFQSGDGKKHRKMEYVGDFRFRLDGSDLDTVEDCKGFATAAFKLKWKLVQKQYPEIIFVIWK